MTDLAVHFADLAATIDRIGVTRDDMLRCDLYDGKLTIHLKANVASRVALAHGEAASHTVCDHMNTAVVMTHHHRVNVTGTNGKVQVLWVTLSAAVAA
jgi:hypothetical protein